MFSYLKSFILREKPFLLIILVAVWYLLTLNPNWKPTWDSATYITLGKSLITGHGYKYMGYSYIKYPPVFPLLLSPIIGIFGYNYLLMRLMIVIMGICSIGMAYLICRRIFDAEDNQMLTKIMAVSVMLLSAFSYPLLFEATRILSDIPYMFFSFLALIFIDKYSKTKTYLNKTTYLTIIFILLAYFTRLVGLSIIAAAISYLFWRAKKTDTADSIDERGHAQSPESKSMPSSNPWLNATKKSAFIGLIFIAFASAWIIRNQSLSNLLPSELREAMSYERELVSGVGAWNDITSRVEGNLDYYESLMANIISGKNIKSRTGIIIISLILLCGFLYRAIPNPTLIEFYIFFYVWIYLLWPARQGERFLVPIIPFLFLYFLYFPKLIIDLIGRLFKSKKKIAIINSSVVGIVALALFWFNLFPAIDVIAGEHRTPYYQGVTADYITAILWVKENTPPDSIIVTDRAPWAHLLSSRKAFTFPWVSNTQEVIDFMRKNGVTHVIAIPWGYSETYLMPAIKAHADKFTEIHRIGNSIIYKFYSP